MSVLEKCHNGAVSGKKEKCHKGASCLFWRKVIMVLIWNSKSTIVTFLPEQSWRCFLHHYDFSHFLGPKLQRQFLGWKNAQIPQLIDSDGRALLKDSESGPNSKITKITNMTFLQNTADYFLLEAFVPTVEVMEQRWLRKSRKAASALTQPSIQRTPFWWVDF